MCTFDSKDAYGTTQSETVEQCIGFLDTIHTQSLCRESLEKTWVSHANPESQTTIHGVEAHVNRPQRKYLNQRFPLGKSWTQYFGTERVLLIDILSQDSSINLEVYRKTLTKFCHVI